MLNKTTTYTPKEALDADPNWKTPVKLGRGRMPTGGKEHVEALVAQGYRIKGYHIDTVSSSKSTAPGEPVAPKVVKATAANKEVLDFTILWDEREYKAVDVDGKEHTMRWVCNNCRVSLVQCHCGSPVILTGAVTIVRR